MSRLRVGGAGGVAEGSGAIKRPGGPSPVVDCFPLAKSDPVCVGACLRARVSVSACALGPMTGAMASTPGGPPMRKKHFL